MTPAPQFDFSFPATVRKRRKWYLAICPFLDVASQGATKEKALANLKEAIRGFLADCYERGTLEQVLRNAGFVAAQEPSARSRRLKGAHWLTVAIALLAREQQATRTYQEV